MQVRNSAWGLYLGLAVVAVVAVPLLTAQTQGAQHYANLARDFPGMTTALLTAGLRALAELAGILTAGGLVYLLALHTPYAKAAKGKAKVARRLGVLTESFARDLLRLSSAVWFVTAALLVGVEGAESTGTSAARLFEPGVLSFIVSTSTFAQAWLVTAVLAGLIWLCTELATRWTSLLFPTWLTMFALLAPVVVGQVLVGHNHDIGLDAAIFQTLALGYGLGPVLVLGISLIRGQEVPPFVLRRAWLLAALAGTVVFLSELVITWFKLVGTAPWESVTGWQATVRLAAMLGGAVVLWQSRRAATAGRLNSARVLRYAVAAAGLLALVISVGTAMTRVAPPHYFVPTSIVVNFLGFEVPDAPSFAVLLTHWRINLLFVVAAVVAVGGYLLAVRTLRKRGDHWPVSRTISWCLGWFVVVFFTSSGFGRYSAPDFGIHMIVHMSLNMLAPLLMVLGGVITLALRVAKPTRSGRPPRLHEWLNTALSWRGARIVMNPLLVFALFVGSYYGLYLTGLFGNAMRFHWAHQFMNIHFLITGFMYYGIIIGVDRPPRPLPHIGKLGYVMAAMPFHAFFGVVLMTSDYIIAENFYRTLALPWATDLMSRQYFGGGVAWAGGEIPLLIVIVVLAIQWSRQDDKEARRKDRHIDSGRDDEYEAYNRMLAELHARRNPTVVQAASPQAVLPTEAVPTGGVLPTDTAGDGVGQKEKS